VRKKIRKEQRKDKHEENSRKAGGAKKARAATLKKSVLKNFWSVQQTRSLPDTAVRASLFLAHNKRELQLIRL
jgi:hypothetical protein